MAHTLGGHEMMEIHELLNFQTLWLAKAKGLDGLITDRELKTFVEQQLPSATQSICELTTLLQTANPAPFGR